MIDAVKKSLVLITILQCISFCSVSIKKKEDWGSFTVYNVRNDYVQRIRYVKTFYLNNSIFGLISKKELREEDLCDGVEIEHIKFFSVFSDFMCFIVSDLLPSLSWSRVPKMSILIYISLLFLPYLLEQGTRKIQTVTIQLKGSEKEGKKEVRFNPVNWRIHQKQVEPAETL